MLVLDLILIGFVIAVEPIPLSAMILLLAAERGLLKGLGFTLGWLLTILGIVFLTVAITGGKPLIPQSKPSTAALCVKLAIGVLLVYLGYRRQRRRGAMSKQEKKQPKWMATVDRINPLASAGLAFLLQPWVLVAAGVSTLVEAKVSTGAEYVGLVLFCLWCSASYLTLEVYAAVRPQSVKVRLDALLHWITTHTDQAIVFLFLGLGLYLVAKSIYGLVS